MNGKEPTKTRWKKTVRQERISLVVVQMEVYQLVVVVQCWTVLVLLEDNQDLENQVDSARTMHNNYSVYCNSLLLNLQ